MLSPILVPNCMSIGRCVKFSGNLIFHFAITISFFSKQRYWKVCLDKTNECKCNNILLIKLHQREIHNGRFRCGDVSQHRAGTSKNPGGGGYLVGFWIGMLSTARRLETLRGSKKGGRNYTFCPILMKNRGRNTTFSSFLLKYRGRNYTNFPETWKRGVEMAEHM